MKIAILSSTFSDSTLPLVKNLLSKGCRVDYFYFVFDKKCNQSTGFEFYTSSRKTGKFYDVDLEKSLGCKFMTGYKDSHIYIYQSPKSGNNSKGLVKFLAQLFYKFKLRDLIKHIKDQKYDMIDIIGMHSEPILLHSMLKGEHCLLSFHEIFKNHLKDRQLDDAVEYAVNHKLPIRVFSRSAQNDLLKITNGKDNLISYIPFGLYECYNDFENIETDLHIKDKDYILYLGFIHPYKGISVLETSFSSLKNEEIKLVIAGKGNDPALNKLKDNNSVLVINRWISNSEMVSLIKNCKVVVCPYLSASQSGIPQLAFNFGKPIIATRVGGFPFFIKDKNTGLLIDPNSPTQLTDAINCIYNDKKMYETLCFNIRKFNDIMPEFSWKNIINYYLKHIK